MSTPIAGRRLGLFGGAFDPPHQAHVALAQAAVEQLGLQTLYVCPTGEAWHKSRTLTAGFHRLAMTHLAFADVPHAVVDARELNRPGPSYTVDTVRELAAQQPPAQWYVVMGADQAAALTRWHDWPALLALATVAVAPRPSHAVDDVEPQHFDWENQPQARCVRLALPPLAHSATAVRQRLADRQDIAALVPGAVARYIDQHSLYPNR